MTQFSKPKKDYADIENDSYVKNYIKGVKNIRQRLSLISEFCVFNEMTPKELILEHHKDRIKEPIEQVRIAKKRLHSFFGYVTHNIDERWRNMINDKERFKAISWNSARQYVYSKLASFYKRNNVGIEFQKKEIPPHKEGKKDKIWRNGEVRIRNFKKYLKKLLDSLNHVRDKAILLCKISSGMGNFDLFNLKIKNYKEGYYPNEKICYIKGYRQKSEILYQTCFNSEACNMIDLYIKDRERKGEKITDNSYLFVGNKSINGKYTQLKPRLFAAELRKACRSLEIYNVSPKQIRRWFNRHLRANKIPADIVKRMMGNQKVIAEDYQQIFDDTNSFIRKYVEDIEPHTLLGNGNGRITKVTEKLEELEEENKNMKEIIENMNNLIEMQQAEIKRFQDQQNERWQKLLKTGLFKE